MRGNWKWKSLGCQVLDPWARWRQALLPASLWLLRLSPACLRRWLVPQSHSLTDWLTCVKTPSLWGPPSGACLGVCRHLERF